MLEKKTSIHLHPRSHRPRQVQKVVWEETFARKLCLSSLSLIAGNVLLHSPRQDSQSTAPLTFAAKVSDFGACRRADKQYPQVPVDGSYSWMAPEIIGGAPFSKVRLAAPPFPVTTIHYNF